MAFEDKDKKTKLNNMLSGQASAAAAVGKRTNVNPDDTNADPAAGVANAAGADHAEGADRAEGAEGADPSPSAERVEENPDHAPAEKSVTAKAPASPAASVGSAAASVGNAAASFGSAATESIGNVAAATIGKTAATIGNTATASIGNTAASIGNTAASIGNTAASIGNTPASIGNTAAATFGNAAAAVAPPTGGSAAPAAPAGLANTKEGGGGTPAPGAAPAGAAPAGAAPGGKPAAAKGSAGKITVSTEAGAKGVSASIPRVGVGEKVTFTAQEGGTWRADQTELGTGSSVEWKAPAAATIKNVVFEPFLDSPNKNTQASIPVLVIAPSKVDFKKIGDVPSTGPGMAGVGMTLQVTIGPDDVSFGNAEWLEKPGPAENVSGYFAAYVATGQSLAHPPNPNGLPMGADNKGVIDNAWTKDKPKLPHKDGTTRWWAGSFQWTIPNVYRVSGDAGEHKITNVVQRFTMDDAGAITVTKGAASATAKPDNVMDGDMQKFATVAEAKTFLTPHGRAGCVQAVMNYKRHPKADATSVANLMSALQSFDVMLRVVMTCNKTFAWNDPDKVSVTANGQKADVGTRSLKKGDKGEYLFHINKLLDMKNLSAVPINIAADAKDFFSSHVHTVSLGYPYSAGPGTAMSGSDNYTYSAAFA